jgi:hypothetical protein
LSADSIKLALETSTGNGDGRFKGTGFVKSHGVERMHMLTGIEPPMGSTEIALMAHAGA